MNSELIKPEASVLRHCKHQLPPQPADQLAESAADEL